MGDFDFDLFVIGAGSGGMRASRLSAGFGARVGIAEDRPLGGTCVNVGCIPKKLLVYAAHFAEDLADAEAGYGWSRGERAHDWAALIRNKNGEIERLNGIYRRMLDHAGVELVDGRARVTGAHEVMVGERRISARHILVATGGWPVVPEIPGREHAITSNEAFFLKERPQRAAVVGGGYIGVEFAGIFHGLGSEVTQLYRGPLFLRGFDDDMREALAVEMRRKGIDLRFEVDVEAIERRGDARVLRLSDGSSLEVDEVLFATGRVPNSRDMGLEEVGVALDENGAVVVDEYSRSSLPSIHAIGDVTDRIQLTPVAIHEGICLANTLFNDRPMSPDHKDVPSAVFSQPPIGTVGLTESEARAAGHDVEIYCSAFRPLKHTLTGSDERMTMKLVVDRPSDRVLGVHMLGTDAGEIVQGFAVALKCNATKAQFDATIPIHPTSAEELVTMREPVSDA